MENVNDSVFGNRPHLFLGSRLKRLAEQMQADASALTQRAGISVPAGLYAVLVALDGQKSLTITALADLMKVSQPSMTKSIGKLVDAALVEVKRGSSDKRRSMVQLTKSGQSAIDEGRRKVWDLIDTAVQEVTEGLSGSFVEQLNEIERRLAIRSLTDRSAANATVALRRASDTDVPALVALLNRAYRGSDTCASWNTEADYMDGDRTSAALLRQEITEKPNAMLLVWEFCGALQGCVWLEAIGDDKWYLGSLAIDPMIQNAQAGRGLLTASEDWVRALGGRCIRMTVVNVRETLIAWYERRGYCLTDEIEPYPYEDGRFGKPKRPDLHFVVLEKAL